MSFNNEACRLMFCPHCHMHGHLLFGDETRSAEFHSVKEALVVIARAFGENKIRQGEVSALRLLALTGGHLLPLTDADEGVNEVKAEARVCATLPLVHI